MIKSFLLTNEFIEKLVNYNKIMKANILVYTPSLGSANIIGIGGEEDSFGVVKTLSLPFSLETYPIMNFAVLAKDINLLYKYSTESGSPIYANVLSTPWTIDKMQYIFCVDKYKQCLDYDACYFKSINLLCTWDQAMPVSILQNIESMPEFNVVMNAKADDGIVIVRKDAMTYFIPPMAINILKGETADLETRFDPVTKIVYICITIHKKKNIKECIYYATLDNGKQ